MEALVIRGTGPTGHYIVNGLLQRGFEVAILHTGRHEVDEIPPEVEHIHTNPFDDAALSAAIAGRHWDLTIATYGRLRRVAHVLVGHTQRFMSVGGGPAYRGYMNAEALWPPGMAVPTAEDAPKTRNEAEDGKGYRVLKSEEEVFTAHPDATHFRYPYIYGKYQIAPREWPIVKRILDQRPPVRFVKGKGRCGPPHMDRVPMHKDHRNQGEDTQRQIRQLRYVVEQARARREAASESQRYHLVEQQERDHASERRQPPHVPLSKQADRPHEGYRATNN